MDPDEHFERAYQDEQRALRDEQGAIMAEIEQIAEKSGNEPEHVLGPADKWYASILPEEELSEAEWQAHLARGRAELDRIARGHLANLEAEMEEARWTLPKLKRALIWERMGADTPGDEPERMETDEEWFARVLWQLDRIMETDMARMTRECREIDTKRRAPALPPPPPPSRQPTGGRPVTRPLAGDSLYPLPWAGMDSKQLDDAKAAAALANGDAAALGGVALVRAHRKNTLPLTNISAARGHCGKIEPPGTREKLFFEKMKN